MEIFIAVGNLLMEECLKRVLKELPQQPEVTCPGNYNSLMLMSTLSRWNPNWLVFEVHNYDDIQLLREIMKKCPALRYVIFCDRFRLDYFETVASVIGNRGVVTPFNIHLDQFLSFFSST